MSAHASPPELTMCRDGEFLDVFKRMLVASMTPASELCPARPWPSCSRSDGQSIRHWRKRPWWVDAGVSCEPLAPAR